MEGILIAITSLLTVLLGGGSVLFYKQTKKMKHFEALSMEKDVIAKELANKQTANEEWITLYNEQKGYSKRLEAKLQTSNDENKELKRIINDYKELDTKQRLLIANLNWARCEVNGCENRKPPRDFQALFNEVEDMHDDLNDTRDGLGEKTSKLYHYDQNAPINIQEIIEQKED